MKDYDVGLIVGMFLDVPPPGSVQSECQACHGEITIGPTQQALMAKADKTYIQMCMPCAVVFASQNSDGPPKVHQAKEAL